MLFIILSNVLLLAPSAFAFNFRRAGWLDRVVEYHKMKLFNDLREVAPVEIKVTIQPAPEGYVDSTHWDYDSVVRLIGLIQQSKSAKPVRRVLKEVLSPSRRMNYNYYNPKNIDFNISHTNQNKYNDYDYNRELSPLSAKNGFKPLYAFDDTAVIIVSNPVESRLPGAQISLGLLRQILENRAEAARIMPSTKEWTNYHACDNKKDGSEATKAAAGVAADNAITEVEAVDFTLVKLSQKS